MKLITNNEIILLNEKIPNLDRDLCFSVVICLHSTCSDAYHTDNVIFKVQLTEHRKADFC